MNGRKTGKPMQYSSTQRKLYDERYFNTLKAFIMAAPRYALSKLSFAPATALLKVILRRGSLREKSLL
jgi:hypothetical protein